MHELIIIGGGPAGLAAAAYAVRKRMDALFISRRLGGRTNRRLLLPWVEDYEVIVGEETIRRFSTQLDYLDYMRVLEVLGDEYARAVVVEVSDHRDEIEADAIFVEKALIPNSDLVAGLVERDEQGFIRVDARNRTSMPGLFAAGDLTTASSFQVLMGLGDGERAALSAFDYVLGLDSA